MRFTNCTLTPAILRGVGSDAHVESEVEGTIGIITIDHLAKPNALSRQLVSFRRSVFLTEMSGDFAKCTAGEGQWQKRLTRH